jgi:hypothetical protein
LGGWVVWEEWGSHAPSKILKFLKEGDKLFR